METHVSDWISRLYLACRCRRGSTVVTPVKYECDSKNLTNTFARSKILLAEKLTNRALVTPPPAVSVFRSMMELSWDPSADYAIRHAGVGGTKTPLFNFSVVDIYGVITNDMLTFSDHIYIWLPDVAAINKTSQWLPNTPFASISECLVS